MSIDLIKGKLVLLGSIIQIILNFWYMEVYSSLYFFCCCIFKRGCREESKGNIEFYKLGVYIIQFEIFVKIGEFMLICMVFVKQFVIRYCFYSFYIVFLVLKGLGRIQWGGGGRKKNVLGDDYKVLGGKIKNFSIYFFMISKQQVYLFCFGNVSGNFLCLWRSKGFFEIENLDFGRTIFIEVMGRRCIR